MFNHTHTIDLSTYLLAPGETQLIWISLTAIQIQLLNLSLNCSTQHDAECLRQLFLPVYS